MLLNRTPGDISLFVWRVTGHDLTSLNRAIIRDLGRSRPMYMITYGQYLTERKGHFDTMKGKAKGPSSQRTSGNRWNV